MNKILRRKMAKHYLYRASRAVAGAAFAMLVLIAISSFVKALTLTQVPDEKGVPASWEAFAAKTPETITVPITYFDQRIDACDATTTRQFEWGKCKYWTKGALQGIVKPTLGADGLPVPSFTNSAEAWAANHDIFTMNVTGHSPVQAGDNFYRWFHEVDGLSRRVDGRSVTFSRVGNGSTYVYGGQHIYPLDDLAGFDAGDGKLMGADWKQHNFHFTGHMRIPMRISASGAERFYFSGDDDVWVFLNNQLVLDIGGLHEPLGGWFAIQPDGTLQTHVDKVSNVADRTEALTACMKIVRTTNNQCNTDFNNFLVAKNQPQDQTLNIGLKSGDVVYLDFFYAERSSDGSNTKITIENMDWPIPAGVTLAGTKVAETQNAEVMEFTSTLENRDPENPLTVERVAAHIDDVSANDVAKTNRGFLPLGADKLYYTATPEDEKSWAQVAVADPADDAEGFALAQPLTLAPQGEAGDTLYFRYAAETIDTAGAMDSVVSFYTKVAENSSIVYEDLHLPYARPVVETPSEPSEPGTTPEPSEPEIPAAPIQPSEPEMPKDDVIAGDLTYTSPLGQVAFVPNTGVISSELVGFFGSEFAGVILSQWFTMTVLLIFSGAFAVFFSLRQYRERPRVQQNKKRTKKTSVKNKNSSTHL